MNTFVAPGASERVSAAFDYQFPVQDDVPAEVCNLVSINQDGNLVFLTFALAVPAVVSSQEQAAEIASAGPIQARVVARVVMPPQTFIGFLQVALDQNQALTDRLVAQSREILAQVSAQGVVEEPSES